ncbi:hypothetical protein G7081_07005 [Vagococcus coleopterorum]|uniref:Apea-like HEPN domain-containing protein n=1 Tax=Vagococcus coleopterorum TaxID=2714946 RepID=A0A6G8AP26_9ENTE|nr:HEPN domain-containing protein [Vagococcus coleopterorum]QIL46834.1 hypothetical protein G7081_07005 [Vagococcus coleopterorum]
MNKKFLKTDLQSDMSVKGLFFLPSQVEDNEDWANGVVEYSDTGIVITLFDDFNVDTPLDFGKLNQFDVVHCLTECGERLSFFDVCQNRFSNHSSGFKISEYRSNLMISSNLEYVSSLDTLRTKKCSFSFVGMNDWIEKDYYSNVGKSVMPNSDVKNEMTDIKIENKNYLISEKTLITEKYQLPDVSFIIKNSLELSNNSKEESLSISEYKKVVFEINRLLALVLGKYQQIEYLECIEPDKNPLKIKIYRLFFIQQGVESLKQIRSPLIDYKEYSNNFNKLYQCFFDQREKIEPIIENYISDKILPTFAIKSLVNISKTLEMYHRTYVYTEPEVNKEFLYKKNKVLEFIEKEFEENPVKDELKSQLSFVKEEPSFSGKISKLLKSVPDDLRNLFRNGKEISKVSKRITETRNYLTHGGDKNNYPDRYQEISEIIDIIIKLRCITDYYLLKELGFQSELIIESLMDYNGPYQRLFY